MTPIAQLEANLRAGGHTVRRALYMAAHGYATTDEPGNTDEDYRAWMQKNDEASLSRGSHRGRQAQGHPFHILTHRV